MMKYSISFIVDSSFAIRLHKVKQGQGFFIGKPILSSSSCHVLETTHAIASTKCDQTIDSLQKLTVSP